MSLNDRPEPASLNTPGSLEGLRVLDLSRVLAGPFCAMILADLGAEVIKIESPEGDDSRHFGPWYNGESAYYRLFNRSKYGLTMDLKLDEQREQLLELVRRSDILIENFRPGVMARLGLAAEDLMAINPRLIIVSISGFGQDGPLQKAPAYDLIAQAMSGLMSITGWPGGEPTRTGVSLGDLIPGLYGAIAALAAVNERHNTGKGQQVDVAMLDSLISVLESVGMRALHGEEPVACGNDHAMSTPFSTYATGSGSIAIAIAGDRLFPRLTEALNRPEWLEDERFKEQTLRNTYPVEFRAALEEALAPFSADQAIALLSEHQVPVSKVQSVNDALASEHSVYRGTVAVESDGFKTLASPLRLTGSVPPSPAPVLGQHNEMLEQWISGPVRTGLSEGSASIR
ncbi:CaiB/BaiF CoA transferase family protein [Glutamicibacter protophormiae]|uniref:CoA:oxalate CoA-transferase n=1 Tax=Glutamicibacter protophormiae TaxID=37930 RepID=A0ABS4XQR1_GLUPR|nr:CoA transferase [Glutamicibacter protophormiae]MBP2398812.1 CoA:oxalate CoA-transferase [Glutamicibacter protophormiae]WPR65638.1 CoA transferase [Glutamicibacter protophormiae]WPR69135.1 CoA transferase [Glutamicibacter protophormiae]GGL82699.1 CoA transferase [Glutamicibacter protophormiae]